jgi:hypothetical protein
VPTFAKFRFCQAATDAFIAEAAFSVKGSIQKTGHIASFYGYSSENK